MTRRLNRPQNTPQPAIASSDAVPTHKLHKILAQAGVGSRRAMEDLIRAGGVTVNGKLAVIGARVGASDVVRIGRRVIRVTGELKLPRVIIYHKPEGEIVSHNDPQRRPSVFEHLPAIRGGKWLAVGRLDFNTCGLLIFTTSGELANRLMHPRFAVEREYAVRIVGQLSQEQLDALTAGIELADGPAHFDAIEERGGEASNHWYHVTLREGRNRIVRRIFEALGITVSRLMRIRFGAVALPPGLKRQQSQDLKPAQVTALLTWCGMQSAAPEPPRRGAAPAKRTDAAAPNKRPGVPRQPHAEPGRNARRGPAAERPAGPRQFQSTAERSAGRGPGPERSAGSRQSVSVAGRNARRGPGPERPPVPRQPHSAPQRNVGRGPGADHSPVARQTHSTPERDARRRPTAERRAGARPQPASAPEGNVRRGPPAEAGHAATATRNRRRR